MKKADMIEILKAHYNEASETEKRWREMMTWTYQEMGYDNLKEALKDENFKASLYYRTWSEKSAIKWELENLLNELKITL